MDGRDEQHHKNIVLSFYWQEIVSRTWQRLAYINWRKASLQRQDCMEILIALAHHLLRDEIVPAEVSSLCDSEVAKASFKKKKTRSEAPEQGQGHGLQLQESA